MSTIFLRLNDEDKGLFGRHADFHGLTISELVRQTVLERIEN